MGASSLARFASKLAPMGRSYRARSYRRVIHKGWALLGGGGIMAR